MSPGLLVGVGALAMAYLVVAAVFLKEGWRDCTTSMERAALITVSVFWLPTVALAVAFALVLGVLVEGCL